MPQNIDDFNAGVALIMGNLYDNFPNPIPFYANKIPNLEYSGDDPLSDEKISRFIDLGTVYFNAALFLLHEGFIRGERVEGYIIIRDCALTSKGLAALQRIPESLAAKQTSVGEWFASIGKDTVKDLTKDAVKAGVRLFLTGH